MLGESLGRDIDMQRGSDRNCGGGISIWVVVRATGGISIGNLRVLQGTYLSSLPLSFSHHTHTLPHIPAKVSSLSPPLHLFQTSLFSISLSKTIQGKWSSPTSITSSSSTHLRSRISHRSILTGQGFLGAWIEVGILDHFVHILILFFQSFRLLEDLD